MLNHISGRHQWFTLIILATQEAEIRRIVVQSQPRQIAQETLSQKYLSLKKKRLVEWLKVKTLSSSPSTEKKNLVSTHLFEPLSILIHHLLAFIVSE
jgi:hypothetical protein